MTGRLLINIILLVIFVFGGASARSQGTSIRLKSTTIAPAANVSHWIDSMYSAGKYSRPVQVLMHFNQIPTPAQREQLKNYGIRLRDYIPDNTYVATIQSPISSETLEGIPVHSFVNMRPEWKASDYLWRKLQSQHGNVQVMVSFYTDIGAAAIRQFITGMNGAVSSGPLEKYGDYKITIDASRAAALAGWYGVRYISPVAAMVPLDQQSRPAVKGNIAVAPVSYGGYGLTGDSVTVGVGDDASGIYHADMKDRITDFNPSPTSDHGEFVNGIAGGAANVDPLAGGISPHVSLIDHYFDVILPATGAMFSGYNMTLTNNSYEIIAGDCSYAGTYDGYAEFLDTLSIEYPYVQHVFASGNDGLNNCAPYPQGFATVGGGYQPAKNNIVVGSITDFLYEADDESRGPVKDGRIKPEIVAIGLGAYSTVGIDEYVWSAGTSMASPQVVSGLAALTQRYKQLHAGAQPRADLLKTILLDGALDIGNPGPDFSYGFGAMDLYRSLLILDSGNYYSNTMSNGDSQTATITIPPNTGQLKVMLYWNDVPGSPYSPVELVNDLDLTVSGPAGTHLPLAPDPDPTAVNNNATEHPDHINNIEQVVITNPPAGTYTIKVNGYNVPSGPQQYAVAYDIHPTGVRLTFPIGGEQLRNADSIRVFWDAVSNGNTFNVEVSADNGATWFTIGSNLPPDAKNCDFMPVNINSSQCLVRVTRNVSGEVFTSGRFSVCEQPTITLDTAQCPGYMNIHWPPILNASSYYLLRKIGPYMQVVDSTTDTMYSFSGLPLNEKSYVAIQPVIDGMLAYRSVAAIAIANTGNCTNPASAGDLMLDTVLAPSSGRMFTSTQLQAATTMWVRVRNLYTAPCNNYALLWQVNGGAWQSLSTLGILPANSATILNVPGVNLSDTGTYNIRVAITNLALRDPQPDNDTFSFTVLNIPNDTMNLASPFTDGFETMPVFAVSHDSIGISPNGHWDYANANDSGRVRSFVSSDITITGARSVSLDQNKTSVNGSFNTFTGTFNLANYDTATTEVRIDFDYILHGTPKTSAGNIVMARGNDTAAWSTLYNYNLNAYPGAVTHVQSLSLTDAVSAAGCNFSSSTQVMFGQNDTSLIAAIDYGNGMTIDNFNMYAVANDAELVSVVSPMLNNCGLVAPQLLTVEVHNGVNYALHNVRMFYNEDGGATYTGSIDSIAAKGNVTFSFSQPLNISADSIHILNIWLVENGDTYHQNDSILNYQFRNSQIISSFPYLENFEEGNGGYYTSGVNDSWQYGTPASPKINMAASGTKAWKTNLTGNYNDLELSYLYSPCFDISQLANPMLSFSTAIDLENCGNTLCDAAYMEISFDGQTWTKLGAAGQGTNWYDSTFDIWNTEGFTRWHVASIPLPQPGPGAIIHLRFVLSSDPAVTYEGIAVDDIHIFDRAYPIATVQAPTNAAASISGDQWNDFTKSGSVLSTINPNDQAINNVTVALYPHDTLNNPGATQYTLPRSYTIISPQQPSDSTGVRLYLTDSEFVNVLNDTACPSCTPVTDAYRLGITQYDNFNNSAAEDGTLANDTGGMFSFYNYRQVQWVPYDKGYYAQISASPFSEFWFNNGGPTGNFPAGIDYLTFTVFKNGDSADCQWYSLIDTTVSMYLLQQSTDGRNFSTISSIPARHAEPGLYAQRSPVDFNQFPDYYYRLTWTMINNADTFYSPIRSIDSADSAAGLITFNAQMVSHESAEASWSSFIDGTVAYYVLQRAIADGAMVTIANIPSVHHFGQQYDYADVPAGHIPAGTEIHYLLTAVLMDSANVTLPEKTIEWMQSNIPVKLYPNPTHDGTFTILWNADEGTTMQVTLFDATGREMYKASVTAAQWSNATTLHAIDLASGVYFVRMDIGGQRSTVKLVYE